MRMRTKTELRSLARRLRITGLIQRVQGLRGGDYEESFHRALRDSVRAGDTVWDVGANVGYYTTQFSDWAGERGKVVAFEPIPASFAALREQADGRPNVQLLNLALGDRDETVTIALEDDPTSPLNSFATPVTAEAAKLELPVRRGDGVRADEGLAAPDVLKVDVEGFEQEVLEGLEETLREGSCRAVLCEVHFAVLESRGRKHAPDEIVRLLEGHGFTVRWADASHLVARRGEPAAR